MTDTRRITLPPHGKTTPRIVKTYVLSEPIEHGDQKVYQLEFRELKTRDHLAIEKDYRGAGPIEIAFAYIVQITEQPEFVIKSMGHQDFMACQEILLDFLGQAPGTTTKT